MTAKTKLFTVFSAAISNRLKAMVAFPLITHAPTKEISASVTEMCMPK